MRRYIIHESSEETYHAGSKATQDCENILLRNKFQRIDIYNYQCETGIGVKIKRRLQLLKLLKIRKKSIVVLQHPMYIGVFYMKMIRIIKFIRKLKIIFIIHDLESLRGMFKEHIEHYIFLDNTMFQIGDALIVHNEEMKKYLIKKKGVNESRIVVLGLFDYLAEKEGVEIKEEHKNIRIAIAGNLSPEKSEYIYKLRKLNMNLQFVLYGVNYEPADFYMGNWEYKGSFSPTELVSIMKGDYGLVWDGEEVTSCVGNTGNYLRYNNPHKVSLYIAAELPIIIWEQAALAEFITANSIGIKIDNLERLEEVVNAVSKEEYVQMKENIKKIAEKVRKGEFFEEAYRIAERKVI